MFKVEGHKVIIKDMHRIAYNLFVLFNDGENDVLYTGTNIYGNRILGAIMFDDDDNDFLRFMHVLISDEQYHNFISKKITFRQILEENGSLFLVDKGYDNTEYQVNLISFKDIPRDFQPLENSYCPNFIVQPTFNYSVSLKGQDSDLHRATPEVLNDVNTKFSKFLESSTEFIKDLDLERSIFIQGNKAGSFEIEFSIDLSQNDQLNIYNLSQERINEFLNELYQYIFYSLPKEKEEVFKGEEVESPEFKEIERKLTDIYDIVKLKPKAGLEQKVIDLINYSVWNLKELDYNKGYNRIEFSNITSKGENVPVGYLDKEYIPSVQMKLFKLEDGLKEDVIIVDNKPTNYKIQVYQFNVQTGNGGAFVLLPDDKLERISLHVQGKKSYEHSVFTHSMDEGVLVEITGIAKRVNGRITEIRMNFD